jgi:hypothetical protein
MARFTVSPAFETSRKMSLNSSLEDDLILPTPRINSEKYADSEIPDTVRDITMKEMKLAIIGCIAWIRTTIAKVTPTNTGPIALYLESDVGLFIYFAALLEMNIPVRNPEASIEAVKRSTNMYKSRSCCCQRD